MCQYLFENSLTIINNLGRSILVLKHHIPSLWAQCDTKQICYHIYPCLHHIITKKTVL